MSFTMKTNGTVSTWNTGGGTHILRPETVELHGKIAKSRGGAPVCVPNFGAAPTTGPYTGIQLPKHGLVRDCLFENGRKSRRNTAVHQSGPCETVDGRVSTEFQFNQPWPHVVQVSAQEDQSLATQGELSLHHQISVTPDPTCSVSMPCSIGFHPYFATNSEPFSLHYYDRSWKMDEIPLNEAFFVQGQPNESFIVSTWHGHVEIELCGGYNGYYVWTNGPRSYICVEPVCIGWGEGFRMIDPSETFSCACNLKYIQKT